MQIERSIRAVVVASFAVVIGCNPQQASQPAPAAAPHPPVASAAASIPGPVPGTG